MQEIEKLLGNEDIEVRRDAVEKLGGQTSDAAMKLLLRAMRDTSWRVRKTAVDILLREYKVESYIKSLIELLYIEDNAGARNSAIETLIKLGKRATIFLIEAFDTPNQDVRKFIIDVLGELNDRRSLPLMLEALKDENENVRATAVEHLGMIGDPAVVDALIDILESGDLWTAYPATDALGKIGNKKAIPTLVKTLSVRTLRTPAMRALSKFSEPEILKHIVPLLGDHSKTTQEEAVKAVKNFYHNGIKEELIAQGIKNVFGDRSIEVLVSHAWSTDSEVRISAIFLLGIMKDQSAIAPLLEVSLEEDFAEDVKRALVFIGRDKPGIIMPLLETSSLYQKRFVCDVASEIAAPLFFNVFKEFLKDEDGHIRAIAIKGLSKIGDLKAINLIKQLLSDPYDDVQEDAVKALCSLRSGIDVNEFVNAVNDKNPVIRKNAVMILGEIDAAGAIDKIGFALKDGDVRVRQAVVQALSRINKGDSVKYLTLALTDENSDIRASAALSLGNMKCAGAVESLLLLLNDSDDMVRASAVKALGSIGDRNTVRDIVKMFSDKNGLVAASAIEALSIIGGEEAKTALVKMLSSKDKEIKRTAVKALAPFEGIEKAMLPYLEDADWATRIAAVEVLSKKTGSSSVKAALERLLDKEEDPVVRRAVEQSLNA